METDTPDSNQPTSEVEDRRLYVPLADGWAAHIKSDWDQEYCFAKLPHEDYFHRLVCGEIYVQRGHEKFCLTCALRHNFVTVDRLYWQKNSRKLGEPL